MKQAHQFNAKIWLYPGGQGAWRFITVPKTLSAKIKETYGEKARGWGSLKVSARIGETVWETSIFPERKSATYLLPVKSAVRIKEGIDTGDSVSVRLTIRT